MILAMICFQFPRLYSAWLLYFCTIQWHHEWAERNYSLIGEELRILRPWSTHFSTHAYFSSWIICVGVCQCKSSVQAWEHHCGMCIEKVCCMHKCMHKSPVDLLLVCLALMDGWIIMCMRSKFVCV
jgi:hypothetical protein